MDVTADNLPLVKLEFFKINWLDSWLAGILVVKVRQL